jgi:hypothetical protein
MAFKYHQSSHQFANAYDEEKRDSVRGKNRDTSRPQRRASKRVVAKRNGGAAQRSGAKNFITDGPLFFILNVSFSFFHYQSTSKIKEALYLISL